MTNAERFEKVYGFKPDTNRIPPLPQCWLQKCKGCKYRESGNGCNPLEWWNETYDSPVKSESEGNE